MRILMLAQFYPPIAGGEERHVRNLSAGLVRRGHDVTVATLWYPGSQAEEADSGVRIRRLRGTMQRSTALFRESERRHAPPFPDPELLYGLRQIVLREKPDVVHAHNWMFHSYLPLKRLYAAPLAITLHDFSHVCAKKIAMYDGKVCDGPGLAKCVSCARQHYGGLKGAVTTASNWMSGAAARRLADVFIAVSNAVAQGNRLKELGVPFEVIPNFVPDEIATLSREPDDVVRSLPEGGYILFVGDLDYKKGISVLLEAYSALKSPPPLVLIGRRCATMPSAVPPGVSVFHDWPHGAIMHAWSRCLFGVLPSICADACPTVIMEAMASGKAVAATAIGGIPDLVAHAESGLLVPPADAQSLASAMQALSGDAELREKMSSAALKKVEMVKANWVIPRIERLYERLLSLQSLQQTLSRASA
jgi:glycosyltransferase involved in cell wall biosynthesis